MDLLDIIVHSSSTPGVAGCFVMVVWWKLLVLRDCDQGQGWQQSFPGSFSSSLGVLVSPGYEEENELGSETLTVIEISFHRLHHRILAGYRLVICLQFHHVLVGFQPTNSIHVLLTQPDLVSRENTSSNRSFYSQNSDPRSTMTQPIYRDLGYALHIPVGSLSKPSTN